MVAFVREKKIECGDDYREADLFIMPEREHRTRRRKKEAVSRPAQRNLNEKNSRRYYVQLAEANFGEGDKSVDLTYWEVPDSVEEAERMLRNFIRRLTSRYRKKGLELKYLMVTSDVDGATGTPKRIHHHLFVNGGLSNEEIMDCWMQGRGRDRRLIGRVNVNALIPDKDFNISGKAYYFSRQGGGRKRWANSLNLRKPVRLPDADCKYSMRQLEQKLAADPEPLWGKDILTMNSYEYWAKKFPGWRIVGYEPGYNLFSGWRATFKLRREAR